jgi:hypothetical protein
MKVASLFSRIGRWMTVTLALAACITQSAAQSACESIAGVWHIMPDNVYTISQNGTTLSGSMYNNCGTYSLSGSIKQWRLYNHDKWVGVSCEQLDVVRNIGYWHLL